MLEFGSGERIRLLPPRSLVPRSRPSQWEGDVVQLSFLGHDPPRGRVMLLKIFSENQIMM